VKWVSLSKCPACGYDSDPHNRNSDIRRLLHTRRAQARTLLSEASRNIKEHVKSNATLEQQYRFLLRIKDVNDEVLIWALRQYLAGKYWKQGKGYMYLAAIATSHGLDRENIAIYEKKFRGSPPPDRTDELNEV
jgi:hypothetical protein